MKKSISAAIMFAASIAIALPSQAQIPVVTGISTVKKENKEQTETRVMSAHDILGVSKYTALYDYNVNTTDKSGAPVTETYVTALRIVDDGALFTDYLAYKYDSLAVCRADEKEIKAVADECVSAEYFFEPVIVQNIPEGRMTVYDQAAITLATYNEPFGEIAWELNGETDSVAGYPVNAALGEYGGRKWKVWFTEEIPVSFGPWKLAGLPGLVLRAEDSEGLLSFSLIQFTRSEVPLTIAKKANVVKTERDKFVYQKNSCAQNPMKHINPTSISHMAVHKTPDGNGRIVINDVNIRVPVNNYIPLELK